MKSAMNALNDYLLRHFPCDTEEIIEPVKWADVYFSKITNV